MAELEASAALADEAVFIAAAQAGEAVLIAAAQAGDDGAFAQLVLQHQARLRAQLRSLTHGDAALADDLAQDCFLQAWQALPRFRGEAQLSTWLYRIAYHRYLMHRRAAPPVALSLDDEGAGPAAGQPLQERARAAQMPPGRSDEPGCPGTNTQEEAQARRIDVDRAMALLPEPQQLALQHCFQMDLSHSEAAFVLGWPLGTLKSHVARGKAALAQTLAAWRPPGSSA